MERGATMKKLALLLVVLIIILFLLLYGCGKKKTPEPPEDEDLLWSQDELPDFLPEFGDNQILVGYVLKDAVNVRLAASTDSTSAGKVSRGDMLLILKIGTTTGNNGGDWYEVRYGGKSAYINGQYLEVKEMSADAVISIGSVNNIDSVLNIRAEPNSESEKVGRANKGDKYVVLVQGLGDGSWSKIEYEEGIAGVAYVKSEYLNMVQQMVINMLLP